MTGTHLRESANVQADADALCELFPAVYLAYHRRDGRRDELTGASRAVLLHLAQAGPVTIGEASVHLKRAQSVVSDIVTQLEGHGLLAREADPSDRRRTLVRLTPAGHTRLRRDSDVLDRGLVELGMSRLPDDVRAGLLGGLDALVAAVPLFRSPAPQNH